MKSKIVKHFFVTIIISAIPAFLSYLANSDLIFNKLIEINVFGNGINIPLIQDYCLWIGIALSAILLSGQLIIVKTKCDCAVEERNLLIKMSKDILAGTLGKLCFSGNPDFDVRIFIPKHPARYKLQDLLGMKNRTRKFTIKNIDLIADQGTTKDLEFEVAPEQEGLVGMCYKTKSMVFDDDLEHRNATNYNLGENQISRTSNLRWSICCPVFDIDDKIVAILALDGKSKITIEKDIEHILNEHVVAFSRLLYDSVPQLFKR